MRILYGEVRLEADGVTETFTGKTYLRDTGYDMAAASATLDNGRKAVRPIDDPGIPEVDRDLFQVSAPVHTVSETGIVVTYPVTELPGARAVLVARIEVKAARARMQVASLQSTDNLGQDEEWKYALQDAKAAIGIADAEQRLIQPGEYRSLDAAVGTVVNDQTGTLIADALEAANNIVARDAAMKIWFDTIRFNRLALKKQVSDEPDVAAAAALIESADLLQSGE